MQKLGLNEIREKYLSFFESKGHLRMGSFPLVPKNDPSILLINAGMTPLKPYFTGKETPPRKRVTTCQKCIRTPDIENVGHTARHGTFFEMLGNFSFGDYFKEEVIPWAWEFITEVMEIPVDRLWVTVYEDDDEAFNIWKDKIGVAKDRIVRMGKEDNFWEHGTGPCGPCSEIHYDRGMEYSCGKPDCKLGCDCDRFMEFWNLVFTQFDKDEDGNYNRLPNPNIDTGMGLERLAVIMQGVNNLFEVDTIKNIMEKISEKAGVKYKEDEKTDVSLRAITDHIRSTCFMISDGILPSNEGRGYVLRRLLRRAARHGKLLGIKGTFLSEIADTVFAESKSAYPELMEKSDYIKKIIKKEEERFAETIDQGLMILKGFTDELNAKGEKVLSGADAFKLYDTYGFPLDLTKDILVEQGLSVDEEGFKAAMENQRITAKSARADNADNAWKKDVTLPAGLVVEFDGFDKLELSATLTALIKDGEVVNCAESGDEVILAFDKTPFYSEKGGQVGDTGIIEFEGAVVEIKDSKIVSGQCTSEGVVLSGEFKVGDKATLKVDAKRRKAISRNHSVSHLLQTALKEVLGSHVAQAGSFVTPDRARFDFSHFEAMTKEEIALVEDKVNEKILENLTITMQEMPIEDAKKLGATALFGEKYGDTVRVVKMGDFSIEFCGGTHLMSTSEIGLVKILSEAGVASGVRRIEAVTGLGVMEYLKEKEAVITEIATSLKAPEKAVTEKVVALIEANAKMKKDLDSYASKEAAGAALSLLDSKIVEGGVSLIAAKVGALTVDAMRNMIDSLKDKEDCLAVILSANNGEALTFCGGATKAALSKGIHIGNVIKEVTNVADGRGGGKPDSAQGGGKDLAKENDAIEKAIEVMKSQIK